MEALVSPFLFLFSFVGTKFYGLDGTIRIFRAAGNFRKKLPAKRHRPTTAELRDRMRKGYSLLPLPIQCLDQAVVSWFLLNLNGYPASLKIGVSLAPLYSHAWTQTGDEIFGDVARLADFHVMADYPGFAK